MRLSLLLILFILCFAQFELYGQHLKSEKDLAQIHKETYAVKDSLDKLDAIYSVQLKEAKDTDLKKIFQKKIDSLDGLWQQNNELELNREFLFMRQHPSSSLCLDILDFKMHRSEGFQLYDSFYRAYN